MPAKMLNLGFGNSVVARRVVAILNPSSAPMKRLREDARQADKLLDATQGRRTRSIIITDTGHVVLSSIQTETMAQRYENTKWDEHGVPLGAGTGEEQ